MMQLVSEVRSTSPRCFLSVLAGVAVFFVASATAAAPCEVPDNGTGTVDLPPLGCEYPGDTAGDIYEIVDGLPPGTTIQMVPVHKGFFCAMALGTCTGPVPGGICEVPGGSLGGNLACAQPDVQLDISGTGLLASFNRFITIPLDWEAHSGPRNPGDPVQSFPTEMFRMQGQIFGDPDFCVLNLRAGSQLGLPSPGTTVLSELPAGDWNVDSFFDITYEIDFQACPGSQLEGFSGTTQGTLRIRTGETLPTAPSVSALSQLGAASLAALLLVAGTTLMLRRRAEFG
jgi:hypothetical protein